MLQVFCQVFFLILLSQGACIPIYSRTPTFFKHIYVGNFKAFMCDVWLNRCNLGDTTAVEQSSSKLEKKIMWLHPKLLLHYVQYSEQTSVKLHIFTILFWVFILNKSDPAEYVWFLPYITVILRHFFHYTLFSAQFVWFCMRIEVQATSFYMRMRMIHTNACIKLSLNQMD